MKIEQKQAKNDFFLSPEATTTIMLAESIALVKYLEMPKEEVLKELRMMQIDHRVCSQPIWYTDPELWISYISAYRAANIRGVIKGKQISSLVEQILSANKRKRVQDSGA